MIYTGNDISYYGARYYNPTLGRWMGRDSAGEQKGGNNLFAFCGNGPLNGTDPDGLWEFTYSIGSIYGFLAGQLEIGYNDGQFNIKMLWGAGEGEGFTYNPKDERQPDGFVGEANYELGAALEGIEGSIFLSEDGVQSALSKGSPIEVEAGNQGVAANIVVGAFVGAMGGVSLNF